MSDSLYENGKNLEDLFFLKRDAELIAQRRKLEQMQQTRESLMQVSGIRNTAVLDRLVALGITPDLLATLVVLPLIEVAWADGEVNSAEKKAVLAAASKGGIAPGSVDYMLLDSWLKMSPAPELLAGWIHYIEGLREVLTPQEMETLKVELMTRARDVAEAAGGFLGIGKISPEEQAVLKKMSNAFGCVA